MVHESMCSYNHGEILGSDWFHEGFLSHGSHVSHESRVIIDISNNHLLCHTNQHTAITQISHSILTWVWTCLCLQKVHKSSIFKGELEIKRSLLRDSHIYMTHAFKNYMLTRAYGHITQNARTILTQYPYVLNFSNVFSLPLIVNYKIILTFKGIEKDQILVAAKEMPPKFKNS